MISLLYRLADAARSRSVRQLAGRRGEDLAHRFLRRHGYTVVARNYRALAGSGEIDLVAWDGDTLVFVEVKSRATDEYGTPDRAVNRDKEAYLQRAAADYTRRAGIPWDRVRFDIVTVLLTRPPKLELIRDAF